MSRFKLIFTLSIICAVVISAYCLTDYFKQGRQRVILSTQNSTTTQTMQLIARPPDGLRQRLAEVTLAEQTARQAIPLGKGSSTELISRIIKMAGEYKLKIAPLTTENWSKKTVLTNTYWVLRIDLKTEGKLPDILSFIERLEDKKVFSNLAVEEATLSRELETIPLETSLNQITNVSAHITVSTFGRVEVSK